MHIRREGVLSLSEEGEGFRRFYFGYQIPAPELILGFIFFVSIFTFVFRFFQIIRFVISIFKPIFFFEITFVLPPSFLPLVFMALTYAIHYPLTIVVSDICWEIDEV